jgi:TatA/E family protein of Tat protein translocase
MVMLLVFGPSKLPEMAKSLGQAFKEFQNATTNIEKETRVLTDSLALPNINSSLQANTTTPKKKALENRQALIVNSADAPKASGTMDIVAPRKLVSGTPPPPIMPTTSTMDEKNLVEVAKMLGINVEGKSEEDLKIAIHDRIDGLDVKEV